MSSKPARHPAKPAIKKMAKASGFVRSDKEAIDYIANRFMQDIEKLGHASFCMSKSRVIDDGAILAAAKHLGMGDFEIGRDFFKKRSRRPKQQPVEE